MYDSIKKILLYNISVIKILRRKFMANPILNQNAIQREQVLDGEPMTINGAINKTLILLALLFCGSLVTWNLFYQGATDKVTMLTVVGFLTSIISFIVIMFNRNTVNVMAPVYAIGEGLLLGGFTAMIEARYSCAILAVFLTFMCLLGMLLLYRLGIIRCTEKFRSVVLISTFSICGIYLINFIGYFFHMQIPYIFSSNRIGIIFSFIVVAIASLNLIIDFDFIERGAQNLLPKTYEWYGAFGLMVTLVWLYIEIINLLSKMADR